MYFKKDGFIVGMVFLIIGALVTFGMLYPAVTGKVSGGGAFALELFSVIPISLGAFGLLGIAFSLGLNQEK